MAVILFACLKGSSRDVTTVSASTFIVPNCEYDHGFCVICYEVHVVGGYFLDCSV
jgi:hypothetical protein